MYYNRINLMIPTRKRVANGMLPRLVDSALSLAAKRERLHFSILSDPDDRETGQYVTRLARQGVAIDSFVSDFEQPHLAKCWNALYARSQQYPAMLVSMVGDDMEWQTPGFDDRILEAMNARDGHAIVYCDDCYVQHEKMTVNLFVSRALVEATGYPFMCERFRANMIDVIWTVVGQKAGLLCYLPDVKLRHHHKVADENRDVLTRHYKFAPTYRKFTDNYTNLIVSNLRRKGITNG